MELHRTRAVTAVASTLIAAGVGLVCYGSVSGVWALIVLGGIIVVVGASALWESQQPYHLRIGPDGLRLRRVGIDRLVPWDEVDTVVLARMANHASVTHEGRNLKRTLVLLVPASATFELPLDQISPWNQQPAALLVDGWDVRERPDDIAAALAEHAGGKFHDLRHA